MIKKIINIIDCCRSCSLLKIFFLFVLICVNSWLQSIIIEIKQDGTGDFLHIQQGIDTAVDSDTVLVYPGTYYENIDFSGKNITVTSRYIENQDESYIHNTIIDGNQNGSCVKIINEEDENAMLCGFTVQNGSGTPVLGYEFVGGGGIYVLESTPRIYSCIIQNNYADSGGGIYSAASYIDGYSCPYLSNCTIKYNHAYFNNGGVGCLTNATMEFDPDNLCNIYLNTAGATNDIGGSGIMYEPIMVYVDTFTVMEPNGFFFRNYHGDQIFINYAKIEPVNNDLYVSPEGDDNNSGLSPVVSLQTISMALIKIMSNNLHPNTIHIAEGIYSPSLSNEKYPLNCRSYVSFIGENEETTILDLEGNSEIFLGWNYERNFIIKNLTLTNSSDEFSKQAIHIIQPRNINYSDIIINRYHREYNSIATGYFNNTILDSTSLYLNKVKIINNIGAKALSITVIENCKFLDLLIENNTPNYLAENVGGGGLGISGHSSYTIGSNYQLINSQITNNHNAETSWPHASSGIYIGSYVNINIVNCTVGNNESEASLSAALTISGIDSECNIINSIFYEDIPREILLEQPYNPDETNILDISNSLIQGGETEIYDEGGNIVNWLEGNLDENPAWDIDGEFPYALTSSSPCIDAGTLNLPEGIELPEYDLAGNPRIVGETVDMGAYEYQGNQVNEELIINNERINISVYPNPFKPNDRDHRTSIKFNLLTSCNVELDIYNIKGQKVKTLMDAFASRGEYTCRWDGKDDNGKHVSSGQYICKLVIDEEVKAVRKMVILK